jgi:hypothetical protein
MTILNVRHTTVYRYRRPVRLGDHRLMRRPRDSHDLRLIRTNLNFSPAASVRWIHDVFGNSIAILDGIGRARSGAIAARSDHRRAGHRIAKGERASAADTQHAERERRGPSSGPRPDPIIAT